MQSRIQEIRDHGGKVIAVCADSVEKNLDLTERMKIDFPILSDVDLVAIDAYGLRHEGGNPMEGRDVSRPAVFVLDGEGIIQWRHLTDNWRVRVRPETIVEQLVEMP